MAVVLHESWPRVLARLPDTGMGYQVLELRGAIPHAGHVVVVNGSRTLDLPRGPILVREGVERAVADRLLRNLQEPVAEPEFRVLSRREAVAAKVIESRPASGSGPAADAPIEGSEIGERFLRFSAFANDFRILPDGSVTAGTYVTTYEDGMTHVKTGMDAVRRYALPNLDPAVHRFHLKPPVVIAVRRGTVQPAHGQPGGGAEVIFEEGSPEGTKQKQDQIPPGS